MEAPLGVTFFKKVELYQKICSLDNQSRGMDTKRGLPPLWPLEKKVLAWTYTLHKHLGSAINPTHFDPKSNHSKLEDFSISREELRGVDVKKLLYNLIGHGFATELLEGRQYTGQKLNENNVFITREGLLIGEVLNELENPWKRISYTIWGNLWGHLGATILLLTLALAALNIILATVKSFRMQNNEEKPSYHQWRYKHRNRLFNRRFR